MSPVSRGISRIEVTYDEPNLVVNAERKGKIELPFRDLHAAFSPNVSSIRQRISASSTVGTCHGWRATRTPSCTGRPQGALPSGSRSSGRCSERSSSCVSTPRGATPFGWVVCRSWIGTSVYNRSLAVMS